MAVNFSKLGVLFVGALTIRALLFGLYIRARRFVESPIYIHIYIYIDRAIRGRVHMANRKSVQEFHREPFEIWCKPLRFCERLCPVIPILSYPLVWSPYRSGELGRVPA